MSLKRDNLVCLNYGHYLEQAVSKIANCKWAGRGWPLHRDESLEMTVRRVMPNADWVIYYDFELRKEGIKPRVSPKRKRRYRVATITSDLHKSPGKYLSLLNNERWDAVLMLYTMLGAQSQGTGNKKKYSDVSSNMFPKRVRAPVFHLAPSVEPTMFNLFGGERTVDATFLGSSHLHIPLFCRVH